MRNTFFALLATSALLPSGLCAQKITKLKPESNVSLQIPEPSDICANVGTDTFFVVSDNGILAEIDREGKILRQSPEYLVDFEAVHCDAKTVYAVDETRRTIFLFDRETLALQRKVVVPYAGGRNKGYEALTWNEARKKFVLLTEKDPILLFELNADFSVFNTVDMSKIARDISAASFHNGALWLLSDEDMTLFKLDPNTYSVLAKWKLPVINPEGFAFDKDGKLLVTCDDMQRLYYFPNPEKN